MSHKLPVRLSDPPLLDAIFEIRFKPGLSLSDVLPGVLFLQLSPKPILSRLPGADLPKPLRDSDVNLKYALLHRLEWGNYVIAIGDQNIAISCKLPYPGWIEFSKEIFNIMGKIQESIEDCAVERYSIKYVNVIKSSSPREQRSKILLDLKIGEDDTQDDRVAIQIERHENEIIHLISMATGFSGTLVSGESIAGTLVDVDSIRLIGEASMRELAGDLQHGVNELRLENKKKFFSYLSKDTLQELGAIYE